MKVTRNRTSFISNIFSNTKQLWMDWIETLCIDNNLQLLKYLHAIVYMYN